MAKSAPLPKYIRQELRNTCALKGYSDLKANKSRRLNEQYYYMAKFFHGKTPDRPPQIKMLEEGQLNYRYLHKEVELPATKKNDNLAAVKKLRLKSILSLDSNRIYYNGTDIIYDDLEKMNRTGALLIGGMNLLDLATKAARNYKKALAFKCHKWDSTKMEPKESGDSLEDCIEYVRRKMYLENVKPKDNNSDISSESEDIKEKNYSDSNEIDDGDNMEK